jgi:hypothetical protein
MVALILADVVLVLHLAFVLFLLFGGLLAITWRKAIWLHLPAVAWGVFVEFSGWVCPLTPLESWLREQGGGRGYAGDFLGHYLEALLYPDNLSRNTQLIFGAIVMLVNGGIYLWLWRRERLTSSSHPRP